MPHTKPVEFKEPWQRFVPGQAEAFLRELETELMPGHALHGVALTALGHSAAADDALFQIGDNRVVEVHLTWSQHAEQPPCHDTECSQTWPIGFGRS